KGHAVRCGGRAVDDRFPPSRAVRIRSELTERGVGVLRVVAALVAESIFCPVGANEDGHFIRQISRGGGVVLRDRTRQRSSRRGIDGFGLNNGRLAVKLRTRARVAGLADHCARDLLSYAGYD